MSRNFHMLSGNTYNSQKTTIIRTSAMQEKEKQKRKSVLSQESPLARRLPSNRFYLVKNPVLVTQDFSFSARRVTEDEAERT